MPSYVCANCGGPVGMMAHYFGGMYISGTFHRFPSGGAQVCSPEYTRLARQHFGHLPGFEESLAKLRERRPEKTVTREEFEAAVAKLERVEG